MLTRTVAHSGLLQAEHLKNDEMMQRLLTMGADAAKSALTSFREWSLSRRLADAAAADNVAGNVHLAGNAGWARGQNPLLTFLAAEQAALLAGAPHEAVTADTAAGGAGGVKLAFGGGTKLRMSFGGDRKVLHSYIYLCI